MENSRIEYQLEYAVWEMTHGCNMRCQHCGSSCAQPYLDEMTTKECLHVCDELINMGVKFVTLTGGEPTTKKDWYVIAEKLSKAGIYTNIISNGWFVEDDLVEKIKQAGIAICAISIDGVKETHDKIRKEGSFEKDLLALKKLKYHGVQTMVATTINNENIEELDEMYDIFSEIGVDFWQLQITLPMGNFLKQQTLFVEPGMIEQIIDFAYKKKEGQLEIHLTDGIGYYNKNKFVCNRILVGQDVRQEKNQLVFYKMEILLDVLLLEMRK